MRWSHSFKLIVASLCCSLSFAANLGALKASAASNSSYVVQNGSQVVVTIPLSVLFDGNTNFFRPSARGLVDQLASVISSSQGSVELEAAIVKGQDTSLEGSTAYSQVVELSRILLQSGAEVSYAPLTVKSYKRNDDYGFWKGYPNEDRFVMVGFSVDL
ncbi:hypothetical protein MMH89_04125 [Candidatus Comchoanobacter bicostacola]|uniref:Uncharacterized protein n=1 Tax=Candidatus Comchoanobacter bicostacola TaxID=2919598 RepID=A0ABY5DIG4_9GAMM|nr:hypothetical protein [Candidatus Comchoanobacter bicostacola]UTC24405.1 hypothetical protein MMH89_04125 [Candidatus Comchoanobacter bicostacola]